MAGIYFDHNATTPVRPEVLEIMLPYMTELMGNASSIHRVGQEARAGIEGAREIIARALGCGASEVYFTSGGTEADNWALRGVAARRGGRIVTTRIEHHAVWHMCEYLEKQGREVVYLPVDEYGVVNPDDVRAVLDDDTALVSVMHANNETGSVQPIGEIGALTRARGIPLHVDAVQSFGKIAFSVDEWNADLVSLSAHKINGPKGVGALYIRAGMEIEAQSYGGGHERQMRAGTENVAGIVGFGRAAELRLDEGERLEEEVGALRQRLERGIVAALEDVKVNGHPQRRLGNTLNVSFHGIEAEAVVLGLDLEGIAVGSGSACSSGTTEPSHVLLAMGLESRQAASAVRFSLGWGNTAAEVDSVLGVLPGIIGRLREMSVF